MATINADRTALCVLMAVAGLVADPQVLQVGSKRYSVDDLKTVMRENAYDLPDQAVQKLQQDAALENGKISKDELYTRFFGISHKTDAARAKARELPIISQMAGTRNYMFDIWLNERARMVPVKYLDMPGYWEMVKQTDSYRVREEAGMKQSSGEIAYTFAELSLPADKPLATLGQDTFLSGQELNEYVASNYNLIHPFAKRNKSRISVGNYLIERIAGEKSVVETMASDNSMPDEIAMEREIRGFIETDMLSDTLAFGSKEYLSPSDMLRDLHIAYSKKHADKLNSIKQAINGKTALSALEPAARAYVFQRRLSRVKEGILKKIPAKEVYEWMEAKKFKGRFNDAQFVLSNEKFQELMANSLRNRGIKLSLLKE